MTNCCCGNPEGTNADCERCRLIAEIEKLEAEVMRLSGIITDVSESAIEYTSTGKYQCVQVSLNLWEEICGDVTDGESNCVLPEDQKRNDAMERGDDLRDRAKDEKQ